LLPSWRVSGAQHSWPDSPEELTELQRLLATASPPPWRPPPGALAIGACAVCFARHQMGRGATGDPAWAAAAVLRGRERLASATVVAGAGGPYVPGLLALREGPSLDAAVRLLEATPEVLLVDATGRDHPRAAGLAIHLGAVLRIATVGVTHRPLLATGRWPDDERGATAPLLLDGEHVAAWLRTRAGARPLAIHAGWRTTVEVAVEIVLRATSGYRTPAPLRCARQLARSARARDVPK